MIQEKEMIEIERRAHECRVTLRALCKMAGKHPQSWYRARKRGRAEYSLIVPLENALASLENGAVS